ncbi:hypothetical protein KZZ08_22825 [Roseovarius mucosus]|uniref:hypothetical protein n=1 Tax=Roseovarius mucosus TaxID=215743 RepID=UPI001C5CD783|nr:hypothetical protein [Roseovarius mucosus]MBW4976449.1 hypothetical protein [Roseovarius mucosus]
MQLNTRSRRFWIILAGVWCLFSLVLAAPFSEVMLHEDGAAAWLFSFMFLCLSPFVPLLNDWATKSISYRWVHLLLATAFIAFLILVAYEARRGSEVAIGILLFWWFVLLISYLLTANEFAMRFDIPDSKAVVVCIVGILTAALAIISGVFLGLLFDIEVGPTLGLLTALTIWVLAWYQIRRNKRQFYRWRNLLYVVVSANWIGLAALMLFGDSALVIGPGALIAGIFLYVVPQPKEL